MDTATAKHLIELNHQFYQTFALQFSATRQRLQPGVQRIAHNLPANAAILDLGCGNGELWRALPQYGFQGRYIGLDFSAELLQIARQEPIEGTLAEALFLQTDLATNGWDAILPEKKFDVVLAFAVLHHLPGEKLRRRLVDKIRQLLIPGGRFYHSNWQFLNSQRLRSRIQPWERAGFSPDQVDPGDYLLDWKHGGYGLRYVHHFEPTELVALAKHTGFRVVDVFLSDGETGNLGMYQTWE